MHILNNAAKKIAIATGITLVFALGWSAFAQLRVQVNLVPVPVSVKDSHGQFVTNLTQDDFIVLEDGKPQTISSFSVDPQPLCGAIVIDTGIGGAALRRLSPLFIAITSGFSAFDEMASFRYDHVVLQLSDFTSDHVAIERSLHVVEEIAARNLPTDIGGAPPPPGISGRLGPGGTPDTRMPIQMPISGPAASCTTQYTMRQRRWKIVPIPGARSFC